MHGSSRCPRPVTDANLPRLTSPAKLCTPGSVVSTGTEHRSFRRPAPAKKRIAAHARVNSIMMNP